MKKSILTIAILILSILGISQSTHAATFNRGVAGTLIAEGKNIAEIEIHGNVELYLSDGNTDNVKVYNNYYSDNALVQNQDGILRITNYASEKLVVWVNATDLRKLNVYDNARVTSFGKLSALGLEVTLNNFALAKLDMDTFSATISLNGFSKAEIAGKIDIAELHYNKHALLLTKNLITVHLVKMMNCKPFERYNDQHDLASL